MFLDGGCEGTGSWNLGLLAGVVAAIIFNISTFAGIYTWRMRPYCSRLLSAPKGKVTRSEAVLTSKRKQEYIGDYGGSCSHLLELEFPVEHADGSSSIVKAEIGVEEAVYSKFAEGADVEVLFPVGAETRFEVVSNLIAMADGGGCSKRELAFMWLCSLSSTSAMFAFIIQRKACCFKVFLLAFLGLSLLECIFAFYWSVPCCFAYQRRWTEVSAALKPQIQQIPIGQPAANDRIV